MSTASATCDRERATRATFADHDRDDRYLEPRHFAQIDRDRLGLAALLRAEAGVRAHRVDERHDRHAKALRELHQPERLAVALGVRHAEAAQQILLRVAALLLADHHHRLAVEERGTADERGSSAK
jgi:hypothetical protein